jgi:hypothetical protein
VLSAQVEALGAPPLGYQWRRYQSGQWVALVDDGRIAGATTDTLTINPSQGADTGLYDVVVSNDCGEVTSAAVMLLVVVPGDLDADGDVDLADYALFRAAFGRCAGDAGFNAATDYDGDGCTTLVDYSIWRAYYLAAGGDPQDLPALTQPGDMNCDGHVDLGDINPFVAALLNPAGWQQAHPGCLIENGDINGDGRVDLGDINPFVALLIGG